MIESEARRLARITENVLLTSQLDREDLRIKHEAVDVANLVRTTVEAMATRLPDPVLIELDVHTERSAASGDRDRIQQVVTNLLDNAVKYGGASGIAVRVGAENGAVCIAVTDEGPGIELADQSESSRSSTAGSATGEGPAGTGLRLYISRKLVERMGGTLRVISDPGKEHVGSGCRRLDQESQTEAARTDASTLRPASHARASSRAVARRSSSDPRNQQRHLELVVYDARGDHVRT